MRFLDDVLVSSALLTLVVIVVIKVHAPAPVVVEQGIPVKPAPKPEVPLVAAYAPRKPIPIIGTPVLAEGGDATASGVVTAAEALVAMIPLTPVPVVTVDWVRVSGGRVNMRSGPGVGSDVLASFDEGTPLERLNADGDWVEVRDPASGLTGWMSGRYLETSKPPESAGPISPSEAASAPGI